MAKSDELVKFIAKQVTAQVVSYVDTPKDVRRQQRQLKREQPKEEWVTRWFGMLPLAFGHWLKPLRVLKRHKPSEEEKLEGSGSPLGQ